MRVLYKLADLTFEQVISMKFGGIAGLLLMASSISILQIFAMPPQPFLITPDTNPTQLVEATILGNPLSTSPTSPSTQTELQEQQDHITSDIETQSVDTLQLRNTIPLQEGQVPQQEVMVRRPVRSQFRQRVDSYIDRTEDCICNTCEACAFVCGLITNRNLWGTRPVVPSTQNLQYW